MVVGLSQSISSHVLEDEELEVPLIDNDEPLPEVVRKLSRYLVAAISDVPCTFDQMRSSILGQQLRPLITSLSENVHNQSIICALMILKWQFDNVPDDEFGLNESRGYACEFVAWQFLSSLSYRETIDFLLQELPGPRRDSVTIAEAERGSSGFGVSEEVPGSRAAHERTPLLSSSDSSLHGFFGRKGGSDSSRLGGTESIFEDSCTDEQYSLFYGLNALEIAAIAHAKKFLSQKVVQRIIDDIWNGEIVFWETLSLHSKKSPQILNKRTVDPYSRLRVPIYRKAFEAAFFVSFLGLYYAVLVERDPSKISPLETMMYIWIAAFAYDELSGMTDAGMLFYQMDFWSLWNLGIIGTGIAFVVARIVGVVKQSDDIIDLSFDILSLEALFLVPRICSLVSLNPYFGSLIPVLKEMTKAFLKFMPVVIVLYLGFLTTFTMLARDRLTLKQMSWILVKVFFGSTQIGFDIAQDISPIFGYGLMIVFVSMTNILLISSLISLMSMSLEGVMAHAREEYLFQLSIYVLESSSSRRLTYFMPPLNLIPLLFLRPLRLALSAEALRRLRIVLLKITHLPFVAIILAYEAISSPKRSRRRTQTPPALTALWSGPGSGRAFSGRPDIFPPRHTPLHPIAGDALSLAAGKRRGSPAERRSEARGSGSAPAASGLAGVIDEVERLRSQIEQVAATVAFQQRSH
ncbi:hypothetical protein VTN77DRAFT_420 [Rasamsonia byssochlamydoides]|uniref:uncharacterized protein n=1 Tax=Rasamsonia byssochlamydoides TaxID=89139 RepID=UPI0037423EC5